MVCSKTVDGRVAALKRDERLDYRSVVHLLQMGEITIVEAYVALRGSIGYDSLIALAEGEIVEGSAA